MNRSRRQFLRGFAAAATMAPVIPLAARTTAAQPAGPLIIDTHQHLWDLSKFKLPWLDNAAEVYRHSYRPQEYAEATRGLNIRAVYMEVDVEPALRPAEAEYIIDICRAKSGATRAAVIGGQPDAPGFTDYVKRFAASGVVRGVRQVLHGGGTPAGHCLKDDFVKGIRLLGTLNLSFDLCMRPRELADGLKLSQLAPDTHFVIDHCGNADPRAFLTDINGKAPAHDADAWRRDMDALGKRPNVICKISGVVARAPEKWSAEDLAPIVNHCLDAFGPDKVVFGGDWPVCLVRAPLATWIDTLRQIVAARPEAEQEKLWSANARKFYAVEV
ncbi:MAG: Amidohydrolase [Phycisphaerales bacterium]|nr:Amidohydrolase [Phycisphaerales bacterium]